MFALTLCVAEKTSAFPLVSPAINTNNSNNAITFCCINRCIYIYMCHAHIQVPTLLKAEQFKCEKKMRK